MSTELTHAPYGYIYGKNQIRTFVTGPGHHDNGNFSKEPEFKEIQKTPIVSSSRINKYLGKTLYFHRMRKEPRGM